MSKKIICDNCNCDLTDTEGIVAYRLNLTCEKIPNISGYTCDVMIYPPINQQLNFCGLGCLKNWINKNGNEKIL